MGCNVCGEKVVENIDELVPNLERRLEEQ